MAQLDHNWLMRVEMRVEKYKNLTCTLNGNSVIVGAWGGKFIRVAPHNKPCRLYIDGQIKEWGQLETELTRLNGESL